MEVGAGIGTFAQACLRTGIPREMILVEPAANHVPHLIERFEGDERVSIYGGFVQDLPALAPVDAAVAVNVLEHVEEEGPFLDALKALLRPRGHLLLFVPALPFLYGSLDVAVEHYRRYTKRSLAAALRNAGYDLLMLRYMNAAGILPWLISGRILRRRTIRAADVRFYDRWVIPVIRRLEQRLEPPIGQSLLAVARRPS